MNRRLALLLITVVGGVALAAQPVAASNLTDPHSPIESCFGVAAGQRASTLHDLGEHSSSFDEPRRGIGNLVLRDFGFGSIGEGGSVLASIDGIEATHCP